MDAAAASRFCIDLLEQPRALLEGERAATADDNEADNVHVGWLLERGREFTADPGGRAATTDAAMLAHLFGVLAWLRVSILEWIHQPPPEVGVEVRCLYSWCHHGGVMESVVEITTP